MPPSPHDLLPSAEAAAAPADAWVDVAVAGGGLAGLTLALRLARSGYRVALAEKRSYPFHKVCGEYLSNEARPYLESLGLDIATLAPADIRELTVTAPDGRALHAALPQGGFGVSRYRLDDALYRLGLAAGVQFRTGRKVTDAVLQPDGSGHYLLDDGSRLHALLLVGSWGKRDTLDTRLHRRFVRQRTGWVGVKYHVRTDFATDRIALHNFPGGYCGLSAIEADAGGQRYCLCYLARRDDLRRTGSIAALEAEVLARNPALAAVMRTAEHLYERPEVINEFSFAPKPAVEGGIWMCGDAAGLITPLCGNGMAMAIHGSKLLADTVLAGGWFKGGHNPQPATRAKLAAQYATAWGRQFGLRLAAGRALQRLLVHPQLTSWAVRGLGAAPRVLRQVVRATHGQPF